MFQIPWSEAELPHFVLEVNQVCNIACKTCYKRFSGETKPLSQIEAEIDLIASRRRLQTVSIAGGEPTLHPELPAVVRAIHGRGLKSALITNGLGVDRALLARLKAAGLDLAMFHIDSLQRRADLPEGAGQAELDALRGEKVALCAELGLDAGLSFVLSRENLHQLLPLVEFVFARPEISTLLVTHSLDLERFLAGAGQGSAEDPVGRTDNDEVVALLERRFGITPFGFLPSGRTGAGVEKRLQWINYFVPVAHLPGGEFRLFRTTSGAPDLALLRLYRRLAGRYAFYVRQDRGLMTAQFVLSGLLSGRLRQTARFFALSRRPGVKLRGKRLAFDNGHFVAGDGGQVACMEHCPNPTVRDGKIVPVCLADHQDPTKP